MLSHNDLLANNILVRNSNGQTAFIDYEYSGYNFRGYDIANYFNESLFDYEVEEPPYYHVSPQLPSMPRIRRFIEYYVLSGKMEMKDLVKSLGNEQEIASLLKKHNAEEEAERIYRDIPLCLMLSDLYWGAWAISVSKNPLINFDYISFASVRMNQYHQVKQAFFQGKS